MTVFSQNGWLERGLILTLVALVSACSADKSDKENDGKDEDKKEVKPRGLEPGQEKCADGEQGRVCVTSGVSVDAGAPSLPDAAATDMENVGAAGDAGVEPSSSYVRSVAEPSDAGSSAVPQASFDAASNASSAESVATETSSAPLSDDRAPDSGITASECSVIRGTVRDFRRGDRDGGHPDFETRMGTGEKGLVKSKLSKAHRPQLAADGPTSISSTESFAQWYEDVSGVNASFDVSLQLENDEGFQTFGTTKFFPLDDIGFGDEGLGHNFGFTTELHARFRFDGSGSFELAGDDDLWLFVAGKLLIDLGGVHGWQTATIELAEVAESLGLEVGSVYALDIFHAERHSTQSKLFAKTNLTFVDCE
jgi:fibro-slime domain-containing protein